MEKASRKAAMAVLSRNRTLPYRAGQGLRGVRGILAGGTGE
jgi:hypothetical protein